MKLIYTLCLTSIVSLTACEKNNGDSCPSSITVSTDVESPKVGSTATISVTRQGENDVYHWDGPGLHELNQQDKLVLYDLKVSQRGWYYCTADNIDCNTSNTDSVYLNVQLFQETAACSPPENTATGNAIPDVTFSSVTKGLDPTWNGISLEGRGEFGYPPFEVLFNSYNGNKEPEDGVYITKNIQSFSPFDEPNAISVSFRYQSMYFHSHPDQKVYVSHVNGKLKAVFCDMSFGGDVPGARCTGSLTEL
ncbi:MAG: hypothetical protein EOO05_09000 [Chitinophagaceae bacterium]|nr:MAG: hypothetical protein EOO05_09000 [Chitinophagaceae bacterium]